MATQHHTEYASPVLRAPSPASSVGTAYGADETSLSDSELSQTDFERKCKERLQLGEPRPEEGRAELGQLLIPRPPEGSPEEKCEQLWLTTSYFQLMYADFFFEYSALRSSDVLSSE